MFWGLPEAKICVFILKIEFFLNKSGLRFALSCHLSENIFYSNSYTRKLWADGKSVLRGEFGLIFGV